MQSSKQCIERDAAFNAILNLVTKVDGDGYCWVIRSDAATAIESIPAATVCFGQLTEVITVTAYGAAKQGKVAKTKCLRGCRYQSRRRRKQ